MEAMINGISNEMLNSSYWIYKLDDINKTIMSNDEIDNFNKKIVEKVYSLCDLKKYKETLSKIELTELLSGYKIPNIEMHGINGKIISEEFYNDLKVNTNVECIKDENTVGYGITIRNTSIRSFPTSTCIFKAPFDKEFDRFQESGCQALEPVLILHESKDSIWYFIKSYNYIGWVIKKDIAISSKNNIFSLIDTNDFITVTGDYIKTQCNPIDYSISNIEFTMGTKLPLKTKNTQTVLWNQSVMGNYVVTLPFRDDNGYLILKDVLISKNQDVVIGYLPYTRENIIKQIFKLQGNRYGWGDIMNGRDCSSTIQYVYKSFGIKLPRNADEIEISHGKSFKFTQSMSIDKRCELFKAVKPGAAIFMEGHVMMYLGMEKGVPYIIHAFHGYGQKKGNEFVFMIANETAVTSAMLYRQTGKHFIEEFTSLLQFEF